MFAGTYKRVEANPDPESGISSVTPSAPPLQQPPMPENPPPYFLCTQDRQPVPSGIAYLKLAFCAH